MSKRPNDSHAAKRELTRAEKKQRARRTVGEKHGHTVGHRLSPTYSSWAEMIKRCSNPNNTRWRWYGARGITVCERWLNSFVAFLADMGERPRGTTLDRKDNAKGYEPSNCRWADHKTQCRNRRSSKLTIESVAAIRGRLAQGDSYRTVASAFSVSPAMVAHIAQGRKWA
jgi:hypothetical protein